ncbi:hypothetical protein DVK85_05590 [Flavobacterium arcticum]|uniref:Outer membrane protein beta-barrel domain-containing protein n=1 Tax=Flavobacterium arcticum TaxID=1784713 RepID=A0A345HAX3_9FLAO|nr:outer membrane beta-barrel protein [Flavobacterium arcticum]AXG73733.1 hypothetical protein DVK85_05590 [Flavobacterium arcticum]KAF2511684.1 outer membrane beta-barrel protein [Flavobacterium arcticum]
MSEKKNIDRLFQEKFKDFEAAPPEYVWENIEAELKKDKKRRVIPLWFKLGGIAAVLVIGLFLINPFNTGIEVDNNPVVNSNNPKDKTNNNVTNPNDGNNNNKVVAPANNTQNFSTNEAVATGNENSSGDGALDKFSNSGTNQNNGKSNSKNGFGNNSNAVVNNNSTKNNNSKTKGATTGNNSKTANIQNNNTEHLRKENAVAYNPKAKSSDNSNSTSSEHTGSGSKDNNTINNGIAAFEEAAIAENEHNENTNATKDGNEQNSNYILTDKDIMTEEAVTETVVDTTTTEEPENELEKLLQEKLNEEKDNKDKMLAKADDNKKWNVKPQIAPVFYNSLSEGSPIDAQFAGNSKDYENNLSYGVGVDYAVNDRISIRSGINTVNLNYSTRGVEFFPSMSQQTNNISSNTASRAANLVVQNQSAGVDGLNPTASKQAFNGSMLQEMGYIEVPVEMSYALINRKFGIDVIGGFSTLFLNDNNVSVVTTQGLSSSIGEAENLNNIHFSTNVGIGFKYKFFKSFQASFEPTFKYQINTFSGSSGNFKPYFIGLYSGVSFRF